jgi:putative DNA primase/helicase
MNTTSAAEETNRYLDALYASLPRDAWIVISWPDPYQANGTKPGMLSRWYRAHERRRLVQFIAGMAPQHGIYVGVGLRNGECYPSLHRRGKNSDIAAIPGVWIELDHSKGRHASVALPGPEELLAFVEGFPFRPSLIIDSTGGLHLYLLFKEAWHLDSPQDRQSEACLLRTFQYTVQSRAQAKGWHVDSTPDVSRVLRPAGSFNHKHA